VSAVLRRRLRAPSTESLFVLTIVLFGFRLGAHPIGDNSMFLHLRTGVDMARGLGIPRVDPYSFTAHGHDWVVQSWLASWTYGVLHEFGGVRLVILEQAVLTAALAWLLVRLARAGTPLRTAFGGVLAVGVGGAYWSQRPLLFGLICLSLTVLVVERPHNPWWLVPIAWVWVNTHGSFPLGLVYVALRLAGEYVDSRNIRMPSARHAVALALGLAAGALNPLGPKLLTFAVTLSDKREVFRGVTEWRSPDFQQPEGYFSLLFLTVALAVLIARRVPWRYTVPTVGFLAMGLIAMRNIAPAAVVMAPALGFVLRVDQPRPKLAEASVNWAFLAVISVGFVVFAVSGISGRPLDLRDYPVAATDYLHRHDLIGPGHRLAHNDVVGDYLILRDGRRANVFADDRFDMYPVAVSDDVTALIRGGRSAIDVLDRRHIDTVLWDRHAPLVALLEAGGHWKQVFQRGAWVVLRRQ
jgi:hypothetical protein